MAVPVTVQDVVRYLDGVAPFAYQESYDNAGLLVGDPQMAVTGILTALDTTEAVLDEALDKGCNLIVAHHPIVFSGLKSFTGRNYVERVVIKAIREGLAIIVAHTNLDNVLQQGVNGKIADRLGLEHRSILAPKRQILQKLYTFVPHKAVEQVSDALFKAGAGHIGHYSECSFSSTGTGTFKAGQGTNPTVGAIGERYHEEETKLEVIFESFRQSRIVQALEQAHPYEEVAYDVVALVNGHPQVGAGIVGNLSEPMPARAFLEWLKSQMKTDCVRYTDLCRPTIQRVAVCGGSGSFLLSAAKRAKADVFITADYKYHQFFDADGQLIIADIGHYESEQFTIALLDELLTQKFTNFAVYRTNVTTNPINYL